MLRFPIEGFYYNEITSSHALCSNNILEKDSVNQICIPEDGRKYEKNYRRNQIGSEVKTICSLPFGSQKTGKAEMVGKNLR